MDMDNKGWLYKRGQYRKSWKRRYFVVDPLKHTLCYYQAPPEESAAKGRYVKPLGIIDLTNTTVIVDKDPAKPDNCFRVQTPARDYYISAADPFKMNTWISVLRLNSKLGTLEKTLEKELPQEKKQDDLLADSIVDLDAQYTLSFKLAADKMLKSLGDAAQSSRASLADVSTMKYEIKCQLKKYLNAVKTQRTESESKLKELRQNEAGAHRSLDSINALIVTLDKFLQASRYIQRQTIAIISLNQPMPTTVRTLREMLEARKSSEIPSELINGYMKLLHSCFPEDQVKLMNTPEKFDFLKVLHFYSCFHDEIHLPKLIRLEPAKRRRLEVWRQLVASVNGIKRTCQQLSELTLIEKEINQAINPSLTTRTRPISMCDPEEDDLIDSNNQSTLGRIPEDDAAEVQPTGSADLGLKLYKTEWQGIAKVIEALGKLRNREKEQSQKLDDALHSRELLASFSSKKTPVSRHF
mmetsp:Transcript_11256/g.15701  ORF Transcript_11256/g.15701 Transcript_11256/m.15701 type:complete len:468 (-) Transcript_11256:402-1805(-)